MLGLRRVALTTICAAVLGLAAACSVGGSSEIVVPVQYRDDVRDAAARCDGITASLLAAQIEQESQWDPRARSSSGAVGIAQFMPATWSAWGRDRNGDGVADPENAREAIDAQGRLMCHLYGLADRSGIDGDPRTLALAAYNAGWGPVSEFGGVPPFPETREYVRSIREMEDRVRFR